MKTKLLYVLLLPLLVVNCFSQKIAVTITGPSDINDNKIATKFSQSLSDEIQLSGKFYYRMGDKAATDEIEVRIHPIRVEFTDGGSAGTAIYVEALTFCPKDRAYSRTFADARFFFPPDASVADYTRSFLADVDRLRPH
jgi:hypothetical protein